MPAATTQRASPDALLALATQGRPRAAEDLSRRGAGRRQDLRHAERRARRARPRAATSSSASSRRTAGARPRRCSPASRSCRASRSSTATASLSEFDLDAALGAQAAACCWSTNSPTPTCPAAAIPNAGRTSRSCSHAGIDVWTTLNVQHLESLNDVVQKITGVRVRETVPDHVLRGGRRDRAGRPAARRAARSGSPRARSTCPTGGAGARNFFKPENLTALRELALRRAAERIDADLVEHMQAQAIEGPWAAGERILACIGPDQRRDLDRAGRQAPGRPHGCAVDRRHRRAAGRAARAMADRRQSTRRCSSRDSSAPRPRCWSAATSPPRFCASPSSRMSRRSCSAARAAAF